MNTFIKNKTIYNDLFSLLKNGRNMFYNCRTMTVFGGMLPKLSDGYYMFYNCKLDGESVKRIITSLPDYTNEASHELHIDFNTALLPENEWYGLLALAISKNWTITTNTTYNNYYY